MKAACNQNVLHFYSLSGINEHAIESVSKLVVCVLGSSSWFQIKFISNRAVVGKCFRREVHAL